VQFDCDVDVGPEGGAQGERPVAQIRDPAGGRHLVVVVLEQQHLHRRVAACRCRRPGCVHLVDRAGVEHPHRADTATDAPTEQPPDRLVEHLALDVPQRLIAPLTAPLTAIPRNENER
jgi:hypothetical protein